MRGFEELSRLVRHSCLAEYADELRKEALWNRRIDRSTAPPESLIPRQIRVVFSQKYEKSLNNTGSIIDFQVFSRCPFQVIAVMVPV